VLSFLVDSWLSGCQNFAAVWYEYSSCHLCLDSACVLLVVFVVYLRGADSNRFSFLRSAAAAIDRPSRH